MTIKSAAFLAMIGTILVAVLLTWNFVNIVLNVMNGVSPMVALFSSLIYAFGAVSTAVFFAVFHNAQS